MEQKIYASLEEAIKACFGETVQVEGKRGLYGGDAGDSSVLNLNIGERVFCKRGGEEILCEALGLRALGESGKLSVPQVLALGRAGGGFFLLENYANGTSKAGYWERMGRELAEHHNYVYPKSSPYHPGKDFGFIEDNYLGLGRQKNAPMEDWISFFRERRLLYQFQLARDYFEPSEERWMDHLLGHLEDYLPVPRHPSLLHGDLWSGNVMTGSDGYPLFIDPAVSFGHPEADLAMTELFGGFPAVFYDSYQEVFQMDPGYEERRDLYNLYHLLNHLNLFGTSYLGSVLRILRRYGGH